MISNTDTNIITEEVTQEVTQTINTFFKPDESSRFIPEDDSEEEEEEENDSDEDEEENDSEEDDSEEDDSEEMIDIRWVTYNKLLDSHNQLTEAFLTLLDKQED